MPPKRKHSTRKKAKPQKVQPRPVHAKRKAHKVTPVGRKHKANGTILAGHEERLALRVSYALDGKANGYTLRDIAQGIAVKFECDEPAITTVQGYVARGLADLKEGREHSIAIMMERHERVIRKALPLGLKDALAVNRLTRIDGETMYVIDENAVKEQVAFLNVALKAMSQQAKILGIGVVEPEQANADWMTTMMNAIMGAPQQASARTIEAGGEVLELDSGLPELEHMTTEVESV